MYLYALRLTVLTIAVGYSSLCTGFYSNFSEDGTLKLGSECEGEDLGVISTKPLPHASQHDLPTSNDAYLFSYSGCNTTV